ncbi:MAG TPA: hypothetical protein VMG61_10195 [Usitatibacter sp.]|nr:hypothetical protein [Usitatibacter sp.]
MNAGRAALALLAAAVGAVALAFTWQAGLASLFDDSASYLVMAQAFSPWHAAGAPIAAAFPAEKYPPLFPLLVAVGGGAYDWRIAHAWVAVSFAASVFLLGEHTRAITRSAALGFAAALVLAWMPGMWLNVKGILSEFPYIALSIATLLQYRAACERPSPRRQAALCALLAATVLTRTIGVALLASIALVESRQWMRTRDRARLARSATTLAVALAVAGMWYVLRPSGGEDAYVAFGSSVAQGTAQRGVEWLLAIVSTNLSSMADAWLSAMLIFWAEPWKPTFLLACLVGASALAGTLWRALEAEADAIYVIAFGAILAAWPFPGQMFRLALPAIPFLVANAFWLWLRLASRFAPQRAVRWSAVAALVPLALCVPPALSYVAGRASLPGREIAAGYRLADIAEFYRIPSRPAAEATAMREIGVLADFEQIRLTTPDSARVMWYLPGYVALLAGREGVPLTRPADTARFVAQLAARRPDYVYLSSVHPRDTAHRDGDPMGALPLLLERGDEVWHRTDAAGLTESVLVKIDPARLLRQ